MGLLERQRQEREGGEGEGKNGKGRGMPAITTHFFFCPSSSPKSYYVICQDRR